MTLPRSGDERRPVRRRPHAGARDHPGRPAVAFGGKILLTSEDGDTFVIKAGTKHEVLATNSVGEPVWASLALARGMVFIRGDKHVFEDRAGRGRAGHPHRS
ncbi:MAG: hypothetical protein MZU95_01165 [Desulfomicrobium escambiense]|nr:hypothetical protein [Desulfomicrobium escambiense]